jgi:hypothetical protein
MGTYTEGAPSWVDLASPDVDSARRFYEQLFGWTSRVATEPEAGGYTTFSKDGKAVAAVGPILGEGQPPVWTTYFASDDAEATTRRVESAGGKVLMAPMEVMRYGRMAVYLDPAGAAFAVWQANEMEGAEVVGVPGSLSWNELTTRDPEGSKAFYSAVLGWGVRDVAYEGVTYTVWEVGGKPAAGMMPMIGDMWPEDLPAHWMVYFEVDDTDASAAKTQQLGGTVSVPPTDIQAGRFAVLGDPQGAFFSIIKSDPKFSM